MPIPSRNPDEPAPARPLSRFVGLGLGLALLVGAALRLVAAVRNSPWLDEFHTLFHARAPDVASLVERLAGDNHPPLSFVLVHLARAGLGEDFLALRAPSLCAGLAAVWLVARLARLLGSPSAGTAAALLAAVATQPVLASAEARMYALLALALVGVAESLACAERDGRLPWRTALWLALALHTHYYAAHHLALGLAAALVWPNARRALVRFLATRRGAAVLGLALALAVPWYVGVFPRQLAHGLWSGGGAAGLRDLVESYPSLVVRRVSLLPGPLAWTAVATALALFPLALVGVRRVACCAPLTAAVLAAQVFVLPLWAALASHVVARSGFDQKYLGGAGLALVVLAGVGLAHLAQRGRLVVAVGLCAAPLALASAVAALDAGPEDYRGATARALAVAGPEVAVAPIEWQPDLFPRGQGFLYELERRAPRPLPFPVLVHDEHFDLGAALDAHERAGTALAGLAVLVRGLPLDVPLWQRLEARFGPADIERFGYLRLHLYGAARAADAR
jgi:hypothetical protein